MEEPGSHWKGFHEILCLMLFSKISRESSSFMKIWQQQRMLYKKTCLYFWQNLAHFFRRMWSMSEKIVEKIKTIYTSLKFFPEIRTVYKIMWKNMVGPDGSQMTIRSMRIACRIPKATKTHLENVILITFSRQKKNGYAKASQYYFVFHCFFFFILWRIKHYSVLRRLNFRLSISYIITHKHTHTHTRARAR